MRRALLLAASAALAMLVNAVPNPAQPDYTTLKKTTTSSNSKTSTPVKATSTPKSSTVKTSTSSKKTSTSSKKTSTSSKKVSTSSIKTSTLSKSTSSRKTTASSTAITSSTKVTSVPISLPSISLPSISVPSISLPSISLPSISLPITPLTTTPLTILPTSTIVVPPGSGCTPLPGDAIVNGGFADGSDPWVPVQDPPGLFSSGFDGGYGTTSDADNANAYYFQLKQDIPAGTTATFSLSQQTCLVVGQTYTVSFYIGVEDNGNDLVTMPGCNVGIRASDGTIIIPETPACGGGPITPGSYGTCTIPSYSSDTRYSFFTAPYVATADQITFSVTATCVRTTELANLVLDTDAISVVPAVP